MNRLRRWWGDDSPVHRTPWRCRILGHRWSRIRVIVADLPCRVPSHCLRCPTIAPTHPVPHIPTPREG